VCFSTSQGVSASVVQKGEAVSGDLKVNANVADQVIDIELNQDAKAKVTASFPSLIPNGKLSVGGTVQDLETVKVSASVLAGPLGVKADVANYAAPKADASLCYAIGGGFAVGAMATIKSSSALAYTVAAQSKQGDVTYALTAADQFKTFKASVVTALDSKQTLGAEVVYKKAATATIGYSKKMDGHSFKAVIANPVSAEFNPTLSVHASLGSLIPKTTATISCQVDKTVRTTTFSSSRGWNRRCCRRRDPSSRRLLSNNRRSARVRMVAAGCQHQQCSKMVPALLRARCAINSINISRHNFSTASLTARDGFFPFETTDEVQVRLPVRDQALIETTRTASVRTLARRPRSPNRSSFLPRARWRLLKYTIQYHDVFERRVPSAASRAVPFARRRPLTLIASASIGSIVTHRRAPTMAVPPGTGNRQFVDDAQVRERTARARVARYGARNRREFVTRSSRRDESCARNAPRGSAKRGFNDPNSRLARVVTGCTLDARADAVWTTRTTR